jgi:hypothetical protein
LAHGSEQICKAYLEAPRRWVEEGLKTVSTDEKTGMQALARNAPDLPLKVGQVCRQEQEYTRHGTLCLMANLDVCEGTIVSPSIGETRKEEDFQEHISRTVKALPQAKKWLFVVDKGTGPPAQHAPIGVFGIMGSWFRGLFGGIVGGKRQKWHLKINGESGFISARPQPSSSLFVHAETLFVAESDRNLVWHFKPEAVTSGQLCFAGRPEGSTGGVYCLLQCGVGQAL